MPAGAAAVRQGVHWSGVELLHWATAGRYRACGAAPVMSAAGRERASTRITAVWKVLTSCLSRCSRRWNGAAATESHAPSSPSLEHGWLDREPDCPGLQAEVHPAGSLRRDGWVPRCTSTHMTARLAPLHPESADGCMEQLCWYSCYCRDQLHCASSARPTANEGCCEKQLCSVAAGSYFDGLCWVQPLSVSRLQPALQETRHACLSFMVLPFLPWFFCLLWPLPGNLQGTRLLSLGV